MMPIRHIMAKLIIIVDESKIVDRLATKFLIPVEVAPFSLGSVRRKISDMGITPVLREAERKMGPVVTDNGNFIIDIFDLNIRDFNKMGKQLNAIPGVIENGLFINMADIVYVGSEKGVKTLTKL